MSEVDRLSNSGLYPALPIADKGEHGQRDRSKDNPPQPRESNQTATSQTGVHRVPKSLIDDYA